MTGLDAATLILIMLPLAAMPSTSVALVVTRSITSGKHHGMAVTLGIVLGDLLFVGMALLGASWLAHWLGGFFVIVKYFAGAYLLWLGFSLVRQSSVRFGGGVALKSQSILTSFVSGFVITLGDVKAVFFYASLFPTILDLTALTAADIVAVVTITAFTVAAVKLLYVLSSAHITQMLSRRGGFKSAQRAAGGMMMVCGGYLLAKG